MNSKKFRSFAVNSLILILSVFALFPLFWICITAMKTQGEILREPLSITPNLQALRENMTVVWGRADWLLYYRNTIILTISVWAVQMVVAIPAAYAFAILKFRGAGIFFLLVLMRLMISPESTMLSNYMTVLHLGAYDTMFGIMLPYIVSAQAIFMFRQAFRQLPSALYDSAKIDGCGDFHYMIRIGVPLIKPYITAFSIITCVYQWNAFFWPMLITKTPEKRILPIAMTFFGLQAESGSEWGLTMTAAILVSFPLLLLFVIFQKQFVNSFVTSGIK